ncbi:MAG: DUF3972 domain-containing protein [Wolinella sp.]
MEAWLEIDEFCTLTNLARERVEEMMSRGALKSKEEDGRVLIESSRGANVVVSRNEGGLVSAQLDTSFVEKTIGTILNLHEKVLGAKDESIEALKSENQFLREALFSMQEVYDADKKMLETLREQLRIAQEDMEFMRRKYKLMWGKVAELSPKEKSEGTE